MRSFEELANMGPEGKNMNGMEVAKNYGLEHLPFKEGRRLSQGMMDIVQANPSFYDIYTMRERMEPKLRHTRSIYLRRPANFSQLNVKSTIDTAHLLDCEKTRMWDIFNPYIDEFVDLLSGEYGISRVGRAFITKLLPVSGIDPHVDYGYYFKCYHRFHLPLQTQPGCSFTVEEESKELEAGSLYVLNNCKMHSVDNASLAERVHLIIDAA
jgi:hypothetical protein